MNRASDPTEALPPSPHLPLLISLLLITTSLATVALPAGAYHHGLETVHSEVVDRPGAFGVSVDLAEPGTLELVLNGYGDQLSTPVSHGAVVFDETQDPIGMMVVTLHRSPDRVQVETTLTPAIAANGSAGAGWSLETQGDPDRLAALDARIGLTTAPADEPAGDGELQFRSFVALHGLEPGIHHAIVWLGAAARTELQVQTDASVSSLETVPGTAHVAGDQDLEATLNAQAQESFVAGSLPVEDTRTTGAKVVHGAHADVDADLGLYGIWNLWEDKRACGPWLGCLSTDTADTVCRNATGHTCRTSQISWTTRTTRASGEDIYAFWGTTPGPFTFRLDRQVDAYEAAHGPVQWEQQHAYLSVADVDLPEL